MRAPSLVEEVPTVEIRNGIAHVTQAFGDHHAYPISVFRQFIASAQLIDRAWCADQQAVGKIRGKGRHH